MIMWRGGGRDWGEDVAEDGGDVVQDARQSEGYHAREGSYLATGCNYRLPRVPNVIKVGVTRPAHLGSSPPTQWLPCSAQLESSAGLHLAGAGAGARLGFAAAARTADNTLEDQAQAVRDP